MEGITILNEFISDGAVLAPWFGIGIAAAIIGIVGLFMCLIVSLPYSCSSGLTILTIIFAGFFIFGMLVSAVAPREKEVRYQVTISDSVNFNEFYERYEIVEQEGLIYTIAEKTE